MRMQMIGAMLYGALSLGLVSSSALAQDDDKFPALVGHITPAVVEIELEIRSRPDLTLNSLPQSLQFYVEDGVSIFGTGFFVNDAGYVITASHVLDGFRSPDGQEHPGIKQIREQLESLGVHSSIMVGVHIPDTDKGSFRSSSSTLDYEADIVDLDYLHDLALIKTRVNPFDKGVPMGIIIKRKSVINAPRYVTFTVARPMNSESVFACGYPLDDPAIVTTSGRIATAWDNKVLIRAAAQGASASDRVDIYKADLRINPGNSGGPLFKTSDQSLIGMTIETTGNLSVAIPAKYITAFLDAHHVKWTAASVPSKAKPHR